MPRQLYYNQFEVFVGPGGRHQWRVVANYSDPIMMLTSDIALMHDPQGKYQQWVATFAGNLTVLEDVFSKAWYKLMTRDMGPVTRCLGPNVPPAQPFQNPLPLPPTTPPDYEVPKH